MFPGVAVELSFDHKPTDPLELERIERAGGKVGKDGRVNRGLNLSRALGMHMFFRLSTHSHSNVATLILYYTLSHSNVATLILYWHK